MDSKARDQQDLIAQKEAQFYDEFQRKQKRLAVLYLGALLTLIGIGIGVDWSLGSKLFASANKEIGPPPADVPFTAYSIPSESGAEIACWSAEAENSHATIILVHALRKSRVEMLSRAKFLYEAGYSVLLIDLQAHGESTNEKITYGYLESFDVQAAVADVRQKKPNESIVILGSSLGASAALLAWPLDVDAMILESVCPTVKKNIENRIDSKLGSFGKYLSWLVTWQFQPRVGVKIGSLSPIEKIREVTCPVLILSAQLDERTTVHDAERMFRAAVEPKQLEIIPKATLAEIHTADPKTYEKTVLNFLKANREPRLASNTAPD